MFDDPDALTSSDRRHYADCPDCKARYAGMAEDARAVATLLATPDVKVDAASAFQRIQAAPAAKPRFGFTFPVLRPASRTMFAGLAAAALLVVLVATAFANVLPLFQPKTVEAVFTFDSTKAAAAAAKTGKSLPALPSGMEGAKLTVTVGPAILEVYGNLKANTNTNSSSSPQDINIPQLVIAESSAPVVTSSQDTAKQLENYILSIPA